ncbi:MAG: glutamate-5-semialdehyde dehydrogenase [Planctomycetota bacterium]
MTQTPAATGVEEAARRAKEASRAVACLGHPTKDAVLRDLAARIAASEAVILEANARDMQAASGAGLPDAKLRRLEITNAGLAQMAEGLEQIAAMPDPIGQRTRDVTVPSGLRVTKQRTPLGVVAMIYEARPGVTIDAFALCFKAGNACLLKGGREATESNRALHALAVAALEANGCPSSAIELITTSDRDELRGMLTLTESIDLVIPRGGETLIRFVHEHARVPTVQHFHGVCHVYVDRDADLDTAIEIVATGKTSAPATCNTTECVLVHRDIARDFLPKLAERANSDGFAIRAEPRALEAVGPGLGLQAATDTDFGREYLDLILAARVVDSLDDAVAHIARFGSDHTDVIVSRDEAAQRAFTTRVTSSCVLVNASSRFNDGFQLGLGAEIGISTSRIHAYGPMGLEELTTERYVVIGNGQTR